MTSPAVLTARRLADEVLFPASVAVDAADRVPAELFDALAEAGFYALGLPASAATDLAELQELNEPSERGGANEVTTPHGRAGGVREMLALSEADRCAVAEAFAGGCLSAAFVWLQHRGALRAVVSSSNQALRQEFLLSMAMGTCRGGLAIGAATRTGPSPVTARSVDGGWHLSGTCPWVTGWGMIDVLLLAGRDAQENLIWALVDVPMAREAATEGFAVQQTELVAVQASGTVTVELSGLFVPTERVLLIEPHASYLARDVEALTFNGYLAVGAAQRAVTLLNQAEPQVAARLSTQLDGVRHALTCADAQTAPAARAAASELAIRTATALAVTTGARSVLRDSHAARLIREATFLLTFGTRPAIRAQLLHRLTGL